MLTLAPVREAPTNSLLSWDPSDPARQIQFDEPVLNIDDIQGGVLAPFNKDHRYLYSFRVDVDTPERMTAFKEWLRAQGDKVATTRQVIEFNRKWKVAHSHGDPLPTVSWMSISLAYPLIKLLTPANCTFADQAFTEGMARRSKAMADPTEGEFAPANWMIGGPGEEADLFVILEADLVEDLDVLEAQLLGSIGKTNGAFERAVIATLFRDQGDILPGDVAGHEHFKFLDGVSQPGVRGLLSKERTDVFTLRQNPGCRDLPADTTKPVSKTNQIKTAQGKPGQDILWPGEFVFGYPRQTPDPDELADGPSPKLGENSLKFDPVHKTIAGPEWANDGSFLVYRRLRQKVGAFHQFLKDTAEAHGVAATDKNSAAEVVGSRLVGRWASGAPVLRSFVKDTPELGQDDCANNNFEYEDKSAPIVRGTNDPSACVDNKFHHSAGDVNGAMCPFTAHIRKAYPRDDERVGAVTPNESDTQTHRLMRRGLPYGPISGSTFASPDPSTDNVDRGLQFLSYQTSIENQFEFVIKHWVNSPKFKEPFADPMGHLPAEQGGGHDPILGQSSHHDRKREFTLTLGNDQDGSDSTVVRLTTTTDWVAPTGGGYFFTPSVSAMKEVLSA